MKIWKVNRKIRSHSFADILETTQLKLKFAKRKANEKKYEFFNEYEYEKKSKVVNIYFLI